MLCIVTENVLKISVRTVVKSDEINVIFCFALSSSGWRVLKSILIETPERLMATLF